jgi:hypothetical protein
METIDARLNRMCSPGTSRESARYGVSRSPVTNHHSLITAFLIDTPAIRIEPNSRRINARIVSNRHSSDGLRNAQFKSIPNYGASASSRWAKMAAAKMDRFPILEKPTLA